VGISSAMEGAERPVRDDSTPPASVRATQRWYWLLLLPFLALLYPPLYAHLTPRIFGIPFFYWYQAVWLVITAAITTLVYRRTR
jgi:Protein of unknown function (DUF3311)